MKILVQMEHYERRTLEMEPPLTVHIGERLDRISDANGVDHYFTKDGYYDGWGSGMSEIEQRRD